MGIHERPVEGLSEDGLPELLEVPAVDHRDVDAAFLRYPDSEGIEHAGSGGVVLLVDYLAQSGYGHPVYPHRVGVGARIVCVDGVDRCGVHDPVRIHGACDHGGDGICRVTGLGSSHDHDLAGNGAGCGLLGSLRDLLGHVAESQAQELGVEPRGPDAHDVELAGVPSELPARGRVVTGRLPAPAHHGELHLVLDGEEHLRESGYVIGIIVTRDQHRTADRHHDLVYGTTTNIVINHPHLT